MSDAFAVRTPRDVVRVSGPDAASFLQGQLSQDVLGLPVGACAWTFVLQPQGKVDAWFRITRIAEDSYLADVEGGHGPALVARLQRFKLRVKLDIEALAWQCVAVRGVAAAEVDAEALGATIAPPVALGGTVGVDLLGPAVALPPGVREGDAADLDAWRVTAGVPAMGRELDESTIPAEAGVVEISVSFTKGCYTGQELVARIDSRGSRTPRKLRRIVLDPAAPAGVLVAGAPLVDAAGAEVGVLTTVAPAAHAALAYVRREVEVSAAVSVGGVEARVEALPASA